MTEPQRGLRLQVLLARSGLASRRAAESFILAGRVAVNGQIVSELGARALPDDRIELDGKPLAAAEKKRYILLNKPAGYICAMADPQGRLLAADLISGIEERVYNVGRLDQWSCGLILFTNDGELAAQLVHPSGGIEKEYEFIADGPLGEDFFAAFKNGLVIEGQRYKAHRAQRTGPDSGRVSLVEGKNREIRRVLEFFGRRALRLCRVRIGPLRIEGLREGAFRELSMAEIQALRGSEQAARRG